ncbi:probable multidrug resistance-associated protein lethal(2)03659 [Fopius arisanus]|uniref:Probable multidrug resistance-associated protein lethal(2)03659 n=1 Tax=Fopius arisanus TaxID=64838 RepID=A0A9R1TIF5_9HYME|nr:PREDICTED: probable multidrug resistance-associated protein lethal(2)03659 [Fopius arisanus]
MADPKKSSYPNPRESSNFFGVLFWTWTIRFFKLGYTKILGKEDLYDPPSYDQATVLGDRLEKCWNQELKNVSKHSRPPSLTKVLVRCFMWELIWLGVLQITNEFLLRLGTPMLIGQLLSYFREDRKISYNETLMYAGGVCGATALFAIAANHWLFQVFHLGGRIHIAVCSLVYRKALRLNVTSLSETTPGKIVNLLANDVNRFDFILVFIHYLWSAPLASIIVGYFLWTEAGYSGLIGIAVISIIVPIQSYTGKLSAKFRLETTVKTDERVRVMNEIISGVQVIKMYAWEKPFCQKIAQIRKLELNIIRKNSWIHGAFMTLYLFVPRTALYCTLVGMILFGQQLSTEKVFVFFAYFSVLAEVMGFMFSRGISEIAQCLVTVKRLEGFLANKEFQTDISWSSQKAIMSKRISKTGVTEVDREIDKIPPEGLIGKISNRDRCEKYVPEDKTSIPIKLVNLSSKWDEKSTENTLQDVNCEIEKGKVYLVIGAVGSGKSSLISAILGEMLITEGHVDINGSISYASQEAWIFGSTVRQNILFGQSYDPQRYEEVVRVCALSSDFAQFPLGDQTTLGERGTSLSGGQKARINLARSVYRRSSIYIFDDPLSAVDTQVGKYLFEECIEKYLKGTTRVLVTHQLQYISGSNEILLVENGKLEKFINYDELLAARPEYSNLGACNSESDPDNSNPDDAERKTSVPTATAAAPFTDAPGDDAASEDDENGMHLSNALEKTSRGSVAGSIFINYLKSSSNWILPVIVSILLVATQCAVTAYDMFFPQLVSAEENRYNEFIKLKNSNSNYINEYDIEPAYTGIYTYTGITFSIFLFGMAQSILFYMTCMKSSQCLHDNAFSALIRSGMEFFSKNPSGRILNRFSKDIDAIDDLLPKTLQDAAIAMMITCGVIVITCNINPIFIAPFIVITYVLYWIAKVYVRTSKSLKRLEAVMNAPVFTHLNVTMSGLTTIRAFNAQELLRMEFDRFQDGHSSAWYMFIATSSAFGFALDVFCWVLTIIVTFGLLLASGYGGPEVGLAITSITSITSLLQWGVRQYAEVLNQMMSVERVLQYSSLIPENTSGPIDSPKRITKQESGIDRSNSKTVDWPSEGSIVFKHVFMTYSDDAPPVLKDLNFVVKPQEKVGIVGRTGAGKSSMISALFRLMKVEGIIEIDGVDTAKVSLENLRRNIAIIPQEPVLFSGTLRKNLDPFEDFTDAALWTALEQVELKESVIKEVDGLHSKVVDKGGNFSVGQRQLVCLARAILRNNKILVLDEATANVDPHTDMLIQKTIRSKFMACTVLTIAHRLNTIMDSDKIIVMDNGEIVEFDHPYVLLKNQKGKFSSLVKKTGYAMSDNLIKIAKQSFQKIHIKDASS